MVIIQRKYNWYRPYVYDKYAISSIIFYNENGVIIQTSQGWLENKHKDLDFIKLDLQEIKLKRKEDFTVKDAFLISKGKEPYGDELRADLYINANFVDLHFDEYRKEYDNIRKYYVGKDQMEQVFEVATNVKWLKENLYLYQSKIEEIAKKMETIYSDTTKEDFDNYIKELKKYGECYFKEKENIENYSVEDYMKEVL